MEEDLEGAKEALRKDKELNIRLLKEQDIEWERGRVGAHLQAKVVSHHKTALARQVSEAVRIRRRGGDLHLKL